MRCSLDHETCGKHSGIPACCRAWFKVWMNLPSEARTSFHNARMVELKSGRPDYLQHHWGITRYVLCPGCVQCGAWNYLLPCPTSS